MKIRLLLSCAFLAVFQSACVIIPVPHPTERSPALQGRVIDAKNNPVQGAQIELVNENAHCRDGFNRLLVAGAQTTTGNDGSFNLWPRYNVHLLYYINLSFDFHWPGGSYWTRQVKVSGENFNSKTFRIDKSKSGNIGDLVVTPNQSVTRD